MKDPRQLVAISYARQSINDPLGIDTQHDINRAYIQQMGYKLAQVWRYSDNHQSGATTERDALQQIERLILSGFAPFDVVVAVDKIRFSRVEDPDYVPATRYAWRQKKVSLEFAQAMNITPTSTTGEVLQDTTENRAGSDELKRIVTRTSKGTRRTLLKGCWPYNWAPWGMKRIRDEGADVS